MYTRRTSADLVAMSCAGDNAAHPEGAASLIATLSCVRRAQNAAALGKLEMLLRTQSVRRITWTLAPTDTKYSDQAIKYIQTGQGPRMIWTPFFVCRRGPR
jgi:hypothetical protein